MRCAWKGQDATKIRFDWSPPEVRTTAVCCNFGLPASSFDVFSLGVLVMKLLKGRSWTQEALNGDDLSGQLRSLETLVEILGFQPQTFYRMLDQNDPANRRLEAKWI